ncbi:uncharacterized protein AKAW2_20242A [Aspergillus luchuensis]|uniref:Wax synthase domain-containing protein n=1 Tax=Aspergillus kawachii TaxID=1069201 RepID=A0A7R7W2P8_ASPKA|nr:uncharacterized protein AKAW2_20242A [Aspergillus luchuensis]BCR95302.1 hypothetical protein AKAW2_20242A [Aspergillus luchuensis]
MALVPLQSFSILICPVIILLALNFPGIFYRNAFTQYATVLAVVLTSWEVLLSVTFENPVFAYLVGLFEAWMGIWAFVLVVFIIRARNFRFPPHMSWERLAWTIDLFINLRGIGWNYRWGNYYVPIDVEEPPMSTSKERLSGRSYPPSLANLIMRFVGQVGWVIFCQLNIFPFIKTQLTSDTGSNYNFAVGLLSLLVSLITIVVDIDLLNTTSTLIVTAFDTSRFLGLHAFPWAHPSPWGSLNAVARKGILGNYPRPTQISS